VLLLLVLGLWSIDSGMQDAAVPLPTEAPPAVSAAASFDRGEAGLDVPALVALLEEVNPNLAPSELDRIASAVIRYSAKYALDPELVTAVLLVESSARPWARSPKGAVGLMQVMPYMMEPLELAGNAATIESNIEAGCWILSQNIERLGEEEGISSYFWGSDIRNLAYLQKVKAARAEVRRMRTS
jgi:soluble lytic murein transglycosylase-like protein